MIYNNATWFDGNNVPKTRISYNQAFNKHGNLCF